MTLTLEQVLIESPRFRAADVAFRSPEGDGSVGEADILVACFGVEDTGVPHGLANTQVIEHGAFRSAIGSGRLGKRPFLMDHGDATITGYVDSRKLIGFADGWAEDAAGLRMTGHYNRKTEIGTLAWEQANFEASIPEFSFRWPANEKVEVREGVEYVQEFSDLQEASQVAFGAQSRTGILSLRSAQEYIARENGTGEDRLPSAAQLKSWLGQDAFRALMRSVITDDDEMLKTITAGIDTAVSEQHVLSALKSNPEMARRINEGIADLLKTPEPPPVEGHVLTDAEKAWYERTFSDR